MYMCFPGNYFDDTLVEGNKITIHGPTFPIAL